MTQPFLVVDIGIYLDTLLLRFHFPSDQYWANMPNLELALFYMPHALVRGLDDDYGSVLFICVKFCHL